MKINVTMQQAKEEREFALLIIHLDQDLVLKDLWDNEKDAVYDEL